MICHGGHSWNVCSRFDYDRIEEWESELSANQAEINRLHTRQAELVSRLEPYKLFLSAGDHNTTDWLSATLDISPQTALRLRTLASSDRTELREALTKAGIGLDRAYFLLRLAETGLSDTDLTELRESHSLGKLFRLWDQRRRVGAEDSRTEFSDRYLVIQPSLDQSAHKLWGVLVGADGETVARALHQKETELPVLPDQTSGQR